MYKFDREAYERRMEWYRDARFGMFIHWGLYAIPARGEWVRSIEQIPKEDYMKYFEEFNPVDFEPRKWAKAAKEAGMKYVVLTAKHHDGFCLFDSQYTDFKSTNTKCGRDLVAEYVEAVRAEGLKVGLYFSLLDWFHDDFPHYGDRNHLLRAHKVAVVRGRISGRQRTVALSAHLETVVDDDIRLELPHHIDQLRRFPCFAAQRIVGKVKPQHIELSVVCADLAYLIVHVGQVAVEIAVIVFVCRVVPHRVITVTIVRKIVVEPVEQ